MQFKLSSERSHTVFFLLAALTLLSCKNNGKKVETQNPQPAQANTPYNPSNSSDKKTQIPTELECDSLDNCDRIRFDFVIKEAEGAKIIDDTDLEFEIDEYAKIEFEAKAAGDGSIRNRDFNFSVEGLDREARINVDDNLITITWTPSSRDVGTFSIRARDMDYCRLKEKEDRDYDCDTDTSRDDDQTFTYQVIDPEDTPEARQQAREEAEENRRRKAKTADCVFDKVAENTDVVGEEVENLIGSVVKGIFGGLENVDAECSG